MSFEILLGSFIVFRAREHNLLPCKILGIKTWVVKNGSKKINKTQIFKIFECIFTCVASLYLLLCDIPVTTTTPTTTVRF